MKLLGFNFTKMNVEKTPDFKGKIEIKSNIRMASIEKHKVDLIKQDAVKLSFVFDIDYRELGKLALEGFLILLLDKKSQKDVLENWDKKDFDPQLRAQIINIVIQRTSLQALKLEEELGLPFHIQLPKVTVNQESN